MQPLHLMYFSDYQSLFPFVYPTQQPQMQTQHSDAYVKMSLCTQNAQPYFSVQYYPLMGNTRFKDIRTRKEMEIAGVYKNGHQKNLISGHLDGIIARVFPEF